MKSLSQRVKRLLGWNYRIEMRDASGRWLALGGVYSRGLAAVRMQQFMSCFPERHARQFRAVQIHG